MPLVTDDRGKAFVVKVEHGLDQKARKLAQKKGISMNALVSLALERLVKSQRRRTS